MQPRASKRPDSAHGPKAEAPTREHAPVVVLEPDHGAAGDLQAQLAACGFDWIALVHDLGDARRILAAAPARLVMLSLDQRPTEVLALALELEAARIPIILTSASGGSLVLPGLHAPLTILARGCARETLVAAFEAKIGRAGPDDAGRTGGTAGRKRR